MIPFFAGLAIGLGAGIVLTSVFFRVTMALVETDQHPGDPADDRYYLIDEISRHQRQS